MNVRSMVYPKQSDVHSLYMKPSEVLLDNGNGLLPRFGIAPTIESPSLHGAFSDVARPWMAPKTKEPPQHGWFGSLYNSERGFNGGSVPLKTFDVKSSPYEHNLPAATPKHFLVFDQSGDKTTLVYNSEINRTQFPFNSFNSKTIPPPIEDHSHNSNKRKSEICNDEVPLGWSPDFTTYKGSDDDPGCIRSDSGGEMHEDTEEINALLYSDDEGDDEVDSSDDDEVTSTGHSPPNDEMLDGYKGNDHFSVWFDDHDSIAEEVASSFGCPTKRLKTSHGGGCDDVFGLSLMNNTSCPTNMVTRKLSSSDSEDDAESSCGDSNSIDNACDDFLDVVGSKEGWRAERIKETVGILQSIVPNGGKGKDAVSVIDEAIDYLRCLKVKAKSLGLS